MQTRHIAMTGAPGAGKTRIIKRFAALGYSVKEETATQYISAQLALGRLLPDICGDQVTLQREIAAAVAAAEAMLDPGVPHLLDRAVPDGLAYCRLYGHTEDDVRKHIRLRYHPVVLLLDRFPFEPNVVRIEDDAVAAKLDLLYEQVYLELGYRVVRVPTFPHPDTALGTEERAVWSVDRRVEFMLEHWPK
jgi:predicted ATPase